MWAETERSPAWGAPGSNCYVGLIASTTDQTVGANANKLQVLSEADANDLCKRYQPLAFKIAGQYRNRGVDLDELRSAGLLGLVQASRRFDPGKGAFGGYAKHWIRGQILELFKPNADAMELGRSHSLNVPAFTKEDDDGNTKLNLITENSEPAITADLGALTQRERGIFEARLDGKTLDEVGGDLGISRERVRQLNDRATEKVRTTKGNIARACIRDLIKRRGYKKPSRQLMPFKAIKYPGHSYTAEEIVAEVSDRKELIAPLANRLEQAWWDVHKRSCVHWIGRSASHYRFKNDGPRKFQWWPR